MADASDNSAPEGTHLAAPTAVSGSDLLASVMEGNFAHALGEQTMRAISAETQLAMERQAHAQTRAALGACQAELAATRTTQKK